MGRNKKPLITENDLSRRDFVKWAGKVGFGTMSVLAISALVSFTCPGQRTMKGTRVPASKALYFPPRRLPAGVWPPSSSTA